MVLYVLIKNTMEMQKEKDTAADTDASEEASE